MKQVIIAIIVVAAIIGGAVVLGKDKAIEGNPSNHVYGKADATVRLIEYGDFECPACKAFFPIVEQVKEKYKDKIAFQFANFPLAQIHQNAVAAHRAAEAASNQGKFWEMYEILYTRQEDWNGPSQADPVGATTAQAITKFEGYASELGLNLDQFRADVNNSNTVGTINADTAAAKAAGGTGTPTFVLNGKRIDDTSSIDTVDEFSTLIDQALGETQSGQ